VSGFKVGDEVRWNGLGATTKAEPQVVQIFGVDMRYGPKELTYSFDYNAPDGDGPYYRPHHATGISGDNLSPVDTPQ
jgi:hypothetical protein